MNLRHVFLIGAVALLFAGSARAQTTTGTVRGYVKDANGTAIAGADIQARNTETGVQRATTSRADGSYILPGLVPGTYEVSVRNIGSTPQRRAVVVQIGATLLVSFDLQAGAVELQAVTVEGAAQAVELRTSEVATNVSQQQVQNLPTPSRNFLDLAALAPGVVVSPDRTDLRPRNFTAGAQGPGEVNVFVDGASLKNDLTGGEGQNSGIAGQDNSRGNPFPRSAIQEYRIITQNFKAEYQRASSAIITATTRSGGNTWTGNAFTYYQDKSLVALDSFSLGSPKPDYTRYQVGLSAGGPLIRDRLRFFGSYEGNYQNRAATVAITPPTGFGPAVDSIPFASFNRNFTSPFRETLLFGKLTYEATPQSTIEWSGSLRHEFDIRDFGGNRSYSSAVHYGQDVDFSNLKHTSVRGQWLNEAMLTYSRFRRTQAPQTLGSPVRDYGFARFGSYESNQDFTQKRLGFRDDLTYTGFRAGGEHVIKVGVALDRLTYDVNKGNNQIPSFYYGNLVNCNPNCTGDVSYAYKNPSRLEWAAGNPFLTAHNTTVGLYAQDDWSPTPRLTLNLGIRWDYESHMLNYDYVTPQNVRDTIRLYNAQLQFPIDTLEYFTDGTQRKRFLGAFQPRLGFSYALDQNNITTLFGGVGIYYDRSYFDLSIDETQKLTYPRYTVHFAPRDSTTPGAGQIPWNDAYLTTDTSMLRAAVDSGGAALGEVWLIGNHTKPPRSTQFTLGVRRQLGRYVVSVSYAGVRGVNGLVFTWANFDFNNNNPRTCCVGGSPFHGFNNIIVATNSVKSWYDALQVQVTRPYQRTGAIGWGGGISYSYSTRSMEGIDALDDEFAFPQAYLITKHPINDEKSRLVANWVTDLPYLYGVQFSGLITLGSGPRLDVSGRFNPATYEPGGFTPDHFAFLIPAKIWAFREVDLRLRKTFPSVSGTTMAFTLDLFNAFNFQNFGCYNTGDRTDTANFGKAHCVNSDARRLQVAAEYGF